MKVSKNGLNLIKKHEGLRLKPYLCPAKKATIGYGNTYYEDGTAVKITDEAITLERAENLLSTMVDKFAKQVSSSLAVNVSQNQFDALVSFAYNIGIGNFTTSTLLKKTNKSDFNGAANEFKRWNKSGGIVLSGLVKRREEEEKLFRAKD
jgi:lysozyme